MAGDLKQCFDRNRGADASEADSGRPSLQSLCASFKSRDPLKSSLAATVADLRHDRRRFSSSDALSSTSEKQMMFNDAEIKEPCPGCGAKTSKSLSWIRSNDSFNCSSCLIVRVDAIQLIADSDPAADKSHMTVANRTFFVRAPLDEMRDALIEDGRLRSVPFKAGEA